MFWEKMGWKMPEGPHNRVTFRALKRMFREVGLRVTEHKFYVALPLYFRFISNPVNGVFNRLPLIRRLGLIEVIEIKKV
jgi:hypothetical protein